MAIRKALDGVIGAIDFFFCIQQFLSIQRFLLVKKEATISTVFFTIYSCVVLMIRSKF